MSAFLDMKPGQYVLCFFEPYFHPDEDISYACEGLMRRGAGWEFALDELFEVRQVTKVMPKTYLFMTIVAKRPSDQETRAYRDSIVQVADDVESLVVLRDKLLAIGVETDDAIEKEMYRRIAPFEDRLRAKALKKVHKALPHIFGRVS